MRALLVRLLASVDCDVLTAASLTEAMAIMDDKPPGVIVLDLRLPDSTEEDTLDAVFAYRIRSQVIVVSGFLTISLTVKAMQLGALHVFEKPLVTERAFVEAVRKGLAPAPRAAAQSVQAADRARGAASHFVSLVLRALDADLDLKTLGSWALHVGMSVSMLREACYVVHLPPHDARDFVRVLVAVIRARRLACDFDVLLDIADTRTLDGFIGKAGLTGKTATATVAEFLSRQQFVPAGHEMLRLLRQALHVS